MTGQSSDADASKGDSERHASGEVESSPMASTAMTPADRQNQRLGLRLFCLYALFYGAFVLVNAFAPGWSEWEPMDGLNLAVLWGFALILSAFVLAIIYGVSCSPGDPAGAAEHEIEGKQGQ